MKLNTIIRLPDGRVGTAVYNHIDGVGVIWGEHSFNTFSGLPEPAAMLRTNYPSAVYPCVGEEFEVIKEGVMPNG